MNISSNSLCAMEETDRLLPCSMMMTNFYKRAGCDVVCLVDKDVPRVLLGQFNEIRAFDKAFDKNVCCFFARHLEVSVIYSPVPKITDYHDVRVYQEATAKAIHRAIAGGYRTPMLIVPHSPLFPNAPLCSILGALEALYVPIQMRETSPAYAQRISRLIVMTSGGRAQELHSEALTIEAGRFVARDIGVGDPERMCPTLLESYVLGLFPNLVMEVSMDENELVKDYPLFNAVDRAGLITSRHGGRILFLQYEPPEPAKRTLLLVGKGVCYDTGGADIKRGGVLSGTCRDKYGAATVAGFMQIVQEVRPTDVHVIAALCLLRNSIGEESFVATEIITARSGVNVRVGNTSAEGGMCMADTLCRMKEIALEKRLPDPHFITIGTLTGHGCLAYGEGHSIAIDNSVAHRAHHALRMKKIGSLFGEPIEVSTLRPDDFDIHDGQVLGEDIIQCTNSTSAVTPRGHQNAVAFMILASGLDKHGLRSKRPLKYTHIDVAAHGGYDFPKIPSGSPLAALAKTHLKF